MSAEPRCETCKWWAEGEDPLYGLCQIDPFPSHASLWPETTSYDNCGEHQPKDATDE